MISKDINDIIAISHLMKKYVFDACSLIYLTKIQLKEKLPLLGEILVSLTVKKELLADGEKFTEAKTLKKNIAKKLIKENKSKLEHVFSSKNLGKGEKETIEICLNFEGIPVTDDHNALNFALSLGLKPKTSEVIIFDLFKENIIDYQEFRFFFKKLAVIKALKPEIFSLFKNKAKQFINNIKKTKE